MQLAGSVSTPKKDNAHSQHCPAFFCHGAYEEKLFNSQDIDFIWEGNFFNEGNWKFAIPFDIIFLNAMKNTTKLDKTKL